MVANGPTKTGRVKHWNHAGNYGFIAADPNAADVYFHGAGTVDRAWLPSRGQRVSFQLVREHDGRLRARNVVHVSDA
jgi:cold shock CspA family protein